MEELLAERGVQVSYETVRRWAAKFGTQYADALRQREGRPGRTWHLDEMAVRVGGTLQWLWRAVDEHGQVRAAQRCNNRVEQAHQPTRVRERGMRRFKSATSAQRFLDAYTRVENLLRPGRHRLSAAAYRDTMRERVATWREVAGLRAA